MPDLPQRASTSRRDSPLDDNDASDNEEDEAPAKNGSSRQQDAPDDDDDDDDDDPIVSRGAATKETPAATQEDMGYARAPNAKMQALLAARKNRPAAADDDE